MKPHFTFKNEPKLSAASNSPDAFTTSPYLFVPLPTPSFNSALSVMLLVNKLELLLVFRSCFNGSASLGPSIQISRQQVQILAGFTEKDPAFLHIKRVFFVAMALFHYSLLTFLWCLSSFCLLSAFLFLSIFII